MSRQAKLLKQLETGKSLTAKQIQGSFGLKNPHDAIYQLRNEGYCIYSNPAKLSDGTETIKYRIGTPTKRMVAVAARVAGSQLFTTVA
jgi:hypothetical protein